MQQCMHAAGIPHIVLQQPLEQGVDLIAQAAALAHSGGPLLRREQVVLRVHLRS